MPAIVVSPSHTKDYQAARAAATEALAAGELVIFPTETVYGIAANAADSAAMARLRDAKGRPDRPFTVHIGLRHEAQAYVPDASPLVRRLARRLWPGPLTMVCHVADPTAAPIMARLPRERVGELYHEGTIGLRCPDHAVGQELLSSAGVPVVASSSNRAGMAPPVDVDEAVRELGDLAAYALDGGPTRLRGPSTIVEVRDHIWRVLRQGVVEERTIARCAQSGVLFVCTGNSCRSPLAEYLFRHKLADRLGLSEAQLEEAGYRVASAGTFAASGAPASGGTLDELQARGVDGTRHRSQPLTPELLQQADRVFVMTPEHREDALSIAPGAAAKVALLDRNCPIMDPIGGGPEAYRQCAAQIEQAVDARLEEYVHEDRDW